MSKRLAVILACGVLVSLFSSNVRALTVSFAWAQTRTPHITLVRDWCGWGFHRAYTGTCIRNGTVLAPPVAVAPHYVPPVVVPHVVVAPHYAPPVVVAPAVCPYGYYLGPYGRCLPY